MGAGCGPRGSARHGQDGARRRLALVRARARVRGCGVWRQPWVARGSAALVGAIVLIRPAPVASAPACNQSSIAQVLKLLLAAGCSPDTMHADGYAAIHRACTGSHKNHTEAIRVLVDQGGVNLNQPSTKGEAPLELAARVGANNGTVDFLRERRSDTRACAHAPDRSQSVSGRRTSASCWSIVSWPGASRVCHRVPAP